MNAADAIHNGAHTIGVWGTLPGWIMALSSSGILGFVANLWFRSRKLRLEENADDRAGYGDVIRTLRDEIARLAADHRNCEDRLKSIEGQLEGVHKQLVTQASVMAVNLGASPAVQSAAVRAQEALKGKE